MLSHSDLLHSDKFSALHCEPQLDVTLKINVGLLLNNAVREIYKGLNNFLYIKS